MIDFIKKYESEVCSNGDVLLTVPSCDYSMVCVGVEKAGMRVYCNEIKIGDKSVIIILGGDCEN